MTQLRCTLGALLGLALAACGDNATIVSVNISYADDVAAPAEVHVSLTQGSKTMDDTFAAPTVPAVVDNMTTDVADKQYFKRYDLSGWADGEAILKVELKDAQGAVYMTDEVMFDVEENGAAAAYASFEIPEETSSDTGSSASSGASTAPSSAASDASTSAAADSSTGEAEVTDADDASSTAEGGTSDSGDAASTDDASTEDAE